MPAHTFALLIGVGDYSQLDRSLGRPQGANDLRGADNDVEAMARLVRIMDVPSDHIRVLSTPLYGPNDFPAVAVGRVPITGAVSSETITATGRAAVQPITMEMSCATFGYATRREILAGLSWLSDRLEAHPGSTGIVYYSGHSVLTEQGHLCLCPADTTVRAPGATVIDVTDADAVNSYLRRVSYLSALALAAGTDDPATLWALTKQLRAKRRGHLDVDLATWLRRSAAALKLKLDRAGVARFETELSVLRGGDARADLDWILDESAMSEATIAADLHADPFADASVYRHAISFNKAFFQMLRDVRPDRALHVFLDTCLDSHEGYGLHWQYSGDLTAQSPDGRALFRTGMPQAHGNMVTMLSATPGKPSYRAVFDDRWYGAFTWALVTLLGRTPVQVSAQARTFDITYRALREQLEQLLTWLRCDQSPDAWTGNWELWGQAPVLGTIQPAGPISETLLPVRVKEEIDPGAGGHIFQVFWQKPDKSWDHVAWLIITRNQFDALGRTWAGSADYWVIRSDLTNGVPTGDLELRPPNTSGAPSNPTIAQCVNYFVKPSNFNITTPYQLTQGIFNGPQPDESKRVCNFLVKVGSDTKGYLRWESGSGGQYWWAVATKENPDTQNLFVDLGGTVLNHNAVIPSDTITLLNGLQTAPSACLGAVCPTV